MPVSSECRPTGFLPTAPHLFSLGLSLDLHSTVNIHHDLHVKIICNNAPTEFYPIVDLHKIRAVNVRVRVRVSIKKYNIGLDKRIEHSLHSNTGAVICEPLANGDCF